MKPLSKRVALKSCVNGFEDENGYVKLKDHALLSTLFFRGGRLRLVFCRAANSYEYTVGSEAIKMLLEGTFFNGGVYTATEQFIFEMEQLYPEASVGTEEAIPYPREGEMDMILVAIKEKETVKREVISFLEDFISENSEDLGYVNGYAVKFGLENHLKTAFPDLSVKKEIYTIINDIVNEVPKKDIRGEFQNELSDAITVEEEIDDRLKNEMTSMITDVTTEYIKTIHEPIEAKRQVKEKSIEYFSDVIGEHLKIAPKLSPFERGIALKELILKKPIGDLEAKVREHLEILKDKFIKKLDLIKRCHLCGDRIQRGFLCERCTGEYETYRSKTQKLREFMEKIERLYLREEIDEDEYRDLISSTKEKLITLQESGKKFASVQEYVNL